MQIDSATGLVTWGPTVEQLGQHNVTIGAYDGRGDAAEQSYVVSVHPDPTNRPPVIVSEPVIVALATETYTYDVVAIDPDDDPLTYSLVTAPSEMMIDSVLCKENITIFNGTCVVDASMVKFCYPFAGGQIEIAGTDVFRG